MGMCVGSVDHDLFLQGVPHFPQTTRVELILKMLMLLAVHALHFTCANVGDAVAHFHEVGVARGADAFVILLVGAFSTIATLLVGHGVNDLCDDGTKLLHHVIVGGGMVVLHCIMQEAGSDHNVMLMLRKQVFELFCHTNDLQDVGIEVGLTIVLLTNGIVALFGVFGSDALNVVHGNCIQRKDKERSESGKGGCVTKTQPPFHRF